MEVDNLSPNTEAVDPVGATDPATVQTDPGQTPPADLPQVDPVVDPAAAAVAATPDFVPDLTFTVHDKKKNFDERLKPFITSKEHEELIRELYTKADGIDEVKAKRDDYRNKYQQLEQTINQTLSAAQRGELAPVMQALGVDTSNMGSVLQGLGYKNDDIIKFAYQLAQLTPEQAQVQNQLHQAELERRAFYQQSQQLQNQLLSVQVQSRKAELQSALSKPDIAPLVEAYDRTYGDGKFFEEVANRGFLHYQMTKQDMPVAEAIAQVARLAKPLIQTTPTKPKEELPVIPTINGGGTKGVVGQKPRSIEALRAFAQTLSD